MKRQTLLIAITTFTAGLLLGALVFSQPAPDAADVPTPAMTTPAVAALSRPAADAPSATAGPEIGIVAAVDDDSTPAAPAASAPGSDAKPTVEVLLARIDDLSQGWGRLQADLAELRQRIGRLEQRGSEDKPSAGDAVDRPDRPRTSEEQRDALLRAGVATELAEDILWRRAQVSLLQLNLRDEAARGGWLNTDRYREELAAINEQRVSIRDEIGVDAYDRYLFETGRDNRVLVDSVIPGSAGEVSGLLPGDIIESYGEQPMFGARDLRGATTDGERGELVPMMVRRGSERVELWLPRGPIGIGLDATRVDPAR